MTAKAFAASDLLQIPKQNRWVINIDFVDGRSA
jgi:hypothetical protein